MMYAALSSVVVLASLNAAPPAAAPSAPATPERNANQNVNEVPAIPPTPAAIGELVLARPFVLDSGYTHEWRKEKPTVDAGWIIVVRVNSDLVFPRQVAQPVLMVGGQVAEPMNVGYASGTVVAIVPAPRKADGTPDLDLAKAIVYFGQPILAESIDAATAEGQRKFAETAGLRPLAASAVATATARGGEQLHVANRKALDKALGALVRTYAADETDTADALEGKAAAATPVR